jgi:hypothetical protein
MRTTSAAQRENTDTTEDHSFGIDNRPTGSSTGGPLPSDAAATLTTITGLKQSVSTPLYADMARQAGRLNASSASEEEYQRLLAKRQTLLDKELDGTITRKEIAALELVRWDLDRIEDARFGPSLDILEDAVARYEKFVTEVSDLRADIARLAGGERT